MNTVKEVVVKAVKPSEVKKGIYYITTADFLGDIKVVSTRKYQIGDVIKIKRRNPVDWIWDIVKETK